MIELEEGNPINLCIVLMKLYTLLSMEGRNAICEHTDCPSNAENGLKRSRLHPNLIYLGICPWANISFSKSQIFLLFVPFFLNVRVGLCGFYSFFTITRYYFSIKKKKYFLWHSEDAGKGAFFKKHSFVFFHTEQTAFFEWGWWRLVLTMLQFYFGVT